MNPPLQPLCTPDVQITEAYLEALIRSSEVLERVQRTGRPKVMRLQRPSVPPLILKLWYPKSVPSSETLRPYATRFRRHADRLRRKNVVAPDPVGWGHVEGTRIRFVCYPEIAGRTLREWIPAVDLDAAGTYVAWLHQAGVDFRSLHMGNILWSGGSDFGLIDVTDCYFMPFMSRRRRLRRLQTFCAHELERPFLLSDHRWSRFVRAYCIRAGIRPAWMLARVAHHLGLSAEAVEAASR